MKAKINGKIWYLWIRRLDIINFLILPEAMYRVTVIPMRIPIAFSREINPIFFLMKPQNTLSSQSNPEKEQSWSITLPDFKVCYKSIVIEMVWCWH